MKISERKDVSQFSLKYRPQKFNEVYGHKKTIDSLLERSKENNYARVTMFTGLTGVGKCITGDSLLLTENGFQYIVDFSKGINGHYPLKINTASKDGIIKTSNFFEEKTKETFFIKTNFGFEIEGTPEHKLYTINKNLDFGFKELKDINVDDVVCLLQDTGVFNTSDACFDFKYNVVKNEHSIKKIKIPTVISKDLSRLIGYFVANGNFDRNNIHISTKNKKIQTDIENILLSTFEIDTKFNWVGDKELSISRVELGSFFKYLFNIKDGDVFTARYKKIPKCILQGKKDIQVEFLKALFDCDSWATGDKLEYYTASKKLCSEVQLMLLNLGIVSFKNEKYLEQYDHVYNTLVVSGVSIDSYKKLINYSSLKYDFTLTDKKRNTNIIVVPFVKDYIIKELDRWKKLAQVSSSGKIGNTLHKNKKSFITKIKTKDGITYDNLLKIKTTLQENLSVDINNILFELLSKIDVILSSNYLYNIVVDKKFNTAEKVVYDFVVPEHHNFYANGIINHNTTIQMILLKSMLCDNKSSDGEPCGQCYYCKIIDAEKPCENITILNASNIGIDEARAIEEQCSNHILAKKNIKIFVIDELQEIQSTRAMKNLLKIFEKTLDNCFFILGTMDKQKIDKAILNRSVLYNLTLDYTEIRDYLAHIVIKEFGGIIPGFNLPDMVDIIAHNSECSLRTGLSMLERVLEAKIQTEAELFKELGIVSDTYVNDMISAILQGDIQNVDFKINRSILDIAQNKLLIIYKHSCGITLNPFEKSLVRSIGRANPDVIENTIKMLGELNNYLYLKDSYIQFVLIRILIENKKILKK